MRGIVSAEHRGNLYVQLDESPRHRGAARESASTLRARYPDFAAVSTLAAGANFLYDLVFPDGLPVRYHLANVSLDLTRAEDRTVALRAHAKINAEMSGQIP
jgi:hypothetical protein